MTEKQTSAPLLFAHSRSFPVMYSTPPPVRFNDIVLENFAATMITSANFCESTRVISNDCLGEYRARWAEFWHDATPIYASPLRRTLALTACEARRGEVVAQLASMHLYVQ